MKLVALAATVSAQIAGHPTDDEAERGKKNALKCGYDTLENKGPLKFKCKHGKKGQSCKIKCNKTPKNDFTPNKILCVDNKWVGKKGKSYDASKFGCEEKEGKTPYGGGKTTTKKVHS